MAMIDSAYNYYLSTYAGKTTSRYDAHKKSELRNIYNSIVKINKESPLYKFTLKEDVPKFAIDIKESARKIQNVVTSLSDSDDINNALRKKIAVSSQEEIVSAIYTGNAPKTEHQNDFDIEVLALAKPQINLGTYLDKRRLDISPGTYSFDLQTASSAYEFQFNVNSNDTNHSLQTKIANLIADANINLNASVVEDSHGMSAIEIESVATGHIDGKDALFSISPQGTHRSMIALDVLGIDHIAQHSEDSSFLLNGTPHSSYGNTFTINNTFEVTLHGISEKDHPASIGFKADVDAISDNIQTLVDSYNSILFTADKYAVSQPQSSRLSADMSKVAFTFQNNLESLGLLVNDRGHISIDRALLEDAVTQEEFSENLSVLNDFKNLLGSKAAKASLDPMKYVDKIVVTYKNPGKNFSSPYVTSLYSGMMMNRYC